MNLLVSIGLGYGFYTLYKKSEINTPRAPASNAVQITGQVELTNVKDRAWLESGFILGKAKTKSGVIRFVEISFDHKTFGSATGTLEDGVYSWKMPIPKGAETWKEASIHSIQVQVRTESGTSEPTEFSIKKGINRDFNGDGVIDFAFGMQGFDTAGQARNKGVVSVYYGSSKNGGLGFSSKSLDQCSGTSDCTLIQNPLNEEEGAFGSSVAHASDLNGDGYGDLVVGASGNQGPNQKNDSGMVYVFYGGPGGITPHQYSVSGYSCSGFPDCTAIQNPMDQNSGSFGATVSSASDVNGDGFADILVGAWQQLSDSSVADKGSVYVFYGSSAGVKTHSGLTRSYTCSGPPDCTLIHSPMDETSGAFGFVVAPASDVNGDGFADVLVGSVHNQSLNDKADRGMVYLFYGGKNGLVSHSEDGQTYTCSGPPDCTLLQNPMDEGAGNFGTALASAYDVNGDDFGDVIIGASGNRSIRQKDLKGMAYVFYGSKKGLTSHSDKGSTYDCSGPPDCSALQNPMDGHAGRFGRSVAGIPDTAGGKYSRVLVGSWMPFIADEKASSEDSYLYYGSKNGVLSHPDSESTYTCSGPPDCSTIQDLSNSKILSLRYMKPSELDRASENLAEIVANVAIHINDINSEPKTEEKLEKEYDPEGLNSEKGQIPSSSSSPLECESEDCVSNSDN